MKFRPRSASTRPKSTPEIGYYKLFFLLQRGPTAGWRGEGGARRDAERQRCWINLEFSPTTEVKSCDVVLVIIFITRTIASLPFFRSLPTARHHRVYTQQIIENRLDIPQHTDELSLCAWAERSRTFFPSEHSSHCSLTHSLPPRRAQQPSSAFSCFLERKNTRVESFHTPTSRSLAREYEGEKVFLSLKPSAVSLRVALLPFVRSQLVNICYLCEVRYFDEESALRLKPARKFSRLPLLSGPQRSALSCEE